MTKISKLSLFSDVSSVRVASTYRLYVNKIIKNLRDRLSRTRGVLPSTLRRIFEKPFVTVFQQRRNLAGLNPPIQFTESGLSKSEFHSRETHGHVSSDRIKIRVGTFRMFGEKIVRLFISWRWRSVSILLTVVIHSVKYCSAKYVF